MKCCLMSAGRGERLKPLTDRLPKCILDIGNGMTTMKFWLKTLDRAHIRDVLINLHHLPNEIINYVNKHEMNGVRVTFSKEKELLGSAGTLYANRDYIKGEWAFVVAYSDTWIREFDLRRMINYHKKHGETMTVGLYREKEEGRMVGVAEVKDGKMVGFSEKEKNAKGELAWAGVFVAHTVVLNYLDGTTKDIAANLLPRLTSRVRAFIINSDVIDIGTPEKLDRARLVVGGLGFQALEKEAV